jgi:hypothetical protein
VFIGSEGELALIGNSLADFLYRLEAGETGIHDLDRRNGEDEGALGAWLRSQHIAPKPPAGHYPDFARWFMSWIERQESWRAHDALCIEIGDRLRDLVPISPDAPVWKAENFDVLLVGNVFMMWHRRFGPQSLPHAQVQHLLPLFQEDRLRRCGQFPERGHWWTSWVSVFKDGGARLSSEFYREPEIQDMRFVIPATEFRNDLSQFPKSDYWTDAWLREVLTNG